MAFIDPFDNIVVNDPNNAAAIEKLSRLNSFSPMGLALTNSFYGFNWRGTGNAAPINNDHHGYTFWTKPNCCLSYDNISSQRIFTPLLTANPLTVQRAIRNYLDPRAARGIGIADISFSDPLQLAYAQQNPNWSPSTTFQSGNATGLCDPLGAFIPLLSNNLISCTGWPDTVLDSHNSKPGIEKEVWGMVDSTSKKYGQATITTSFRNIKGDPINYLIRIWVHYMSMIYQGKFKPYPDMVIDNEIDYMTRIYRIILDPTRQFVQSITAANACYPVVSPMGAKYNFNESHPRVDENDQIPIQWQVYGFCDEDDPILIQEFNATVAYFNPNMSDNTRSQYYHKLSLAERSYFSYNGYPRIDPNTNEFQVWVDLAYYNNETGTQAIIPASPPVLSAGPTPLPNPQFKSGNGSFGGVGSSGSF